jgi:amino acid transporter
VLFSAAAVASLFVLRRRPGYAKRPRARAWGYPWAPVVFLLASAAMLVQAVRFAPGPSLAGAALIAAGIPVHLWTRKRAARSPEAVPPTAPTREGETS